MLIQEALFVGLAISIVGFVVSLIIMYVTDPNFSFSKYTFWKEVVCSYFITGFLSHYLFEYAGLNKWYCVNGIACAP